MPIVLGLNSLDIWSCLGSFSPVIFDFRGAFKGRDAVVTQSNDWLEVRCNSGLPLDLAGATENQTSFLYHHPSFFPITSMQKYSTEAIVKLKTKWTNEFTPPSNSLFSSLCILLLHIVKPILFFQFSFAIIFFICNWVSNI